MMSEYPPIEYSFDEFCDHMAAIHKIRSEQRGSDDEDDPYFRSLGVVIDYLTSVCPNQEIASNKAGRFMLIAHYIAHSVDAFDTGDYLVHGSKKVGALVGTHLLRAVHHVFTGDLHKRKSDPTPEEIMRLADELKEPTDGLPTGS